MNTSRIPAKQPVWGCPTDIIKMETPPSRHAAPGIGAKMVFAPHVPVEPAQLDTAPVRMRQAIVVKF
jgi:hypothetical protein